MVDDQLVSLSVISASLAAIGLSVLMLHLRHRRRRVGWIPWNGVLFAAIVIAAVAIAHLLDLERR